MALKHDELEFSPQHRLVQQLLDAAQAALLALPAEEKRRLREALRPFVDFSVAVLWSAADVKAVAPHINDDQAAEALGVYVDNHQCTDGDWEQIREAVTSIGGDV